MQTDTECPYCSSTLVYVYSMLWSFQTHVFSEIFCISRSRKLVGFWFWQRHVYGYVNEKLIFGSWAGSQWSVMASLHLAVALCFHYLSLSLISLVSVFCFILISFLLPQILFSLLVCIIYVINIHIFTTQASAKCKKAERRHKNLKLLSDSLQIACDNCVRCVC